MKFIVDLVELRTNAEPGSDMAKLIECVDAYQSLIKSIEPHLHRNASVYAGFKVNDFNFDFYDEP
jgi:hypothetical protein